MHEIVTNKFIKQDGIQRRHEAYSLKLLKYDFWPIGYANTFLAKKFRIELKQFYTKGRKTYWTKMAFSVFFFPVVTFNRRSSNTLHKNYQMLYSTSQKKRLRHFALSKTVSNYPIPEILQNVKINLSEITI